MEHLAKQREAAHHRHRGGRRHGRHRAATTPRLKGVLPKEYARPGLDKHRLGELINLIGTIVLIRTASGEKISNADLPPEVGTGAAEGKVETPPLPSQRSVHLLGRVYEYFLTRCQRRGPERHFSPEHADTFRRDTHLDLRADYVLANPPFNDSDWFRQDADVRWQFGIPPRGNANFA